MILILNSILTHPFLTGSDYNKKIQLRENLELMIKGTVHEFQNVIKPFIGDDGKKYIKIQSDQGI